MSLTYSNKKPTEPGWYWCFNDSANPGEKWEACVRLDRTTASKELICSWMTKPGAAKMATESEWSKTCLWAGPLTPPQQPK